MKLCIYCLMVGEKRYKKREKYNVTLFSYCSYGRRKEIQEEGKI